MNQGGNEVTKGGQRDKENLIRKMKRGCTGMKLGCRVEKGEGKKGDGKRMRGARSRERKG